MLKKSEEIIDAIILREVLRFNIKDILPPGNLDGEKIKSTLNRYGIEANTRSEKYRPDILQNYKKYRNNLSHGSVSFVEALRDNTIDDMKSHFILIDGFLRELIDSVEDYISRSMYKHETTCI